MKKILIFALLIGLLLLGLKVGSVLKAVNAFGKVTNHFDGKVQIIPSPPGIEDIVVDTTSGMAYLSSHNRRNFQERGEIYRYALDDSTHQLIALTNQANLPDFRPHGIALHHATDGSTYLFAVNHADAGGTIEKFKVEDFKLLHLATLRSPLLVSPNDLEVISPNEIYVTNDHSRPDDWIRKLGDYWQYPSGNVVRILGNDAQLVAEDIPYANGIAQWHDKRTLFVASPTTNSLLVYTRQPNGSLDFKEKLNVGTGVDNISIDFDGNLWVGCHQKLLQFVAHSKDSTKHSASSVIKVVYQPTAPHRFIQEGIWSNDGSTLSGCSVAVYYEPSPQRGKVNAQNALLVGGVFDRKFLRLQRHYPSSK